MDDLKGLSSPGGLTLGRRSRPGKIDPLEFDLNNVLKIVD